MRSVCLPSSAPKSSFQIFGRAGEPNPSHRRAPDGSSVRAHDRCLRRTRRGQGLPVRRIVRCEELERNDVIALFVSSAVQASNVRYLERTATEWSVAIVSRQWWLRR